MTERYLIPDHQLVDDTVAPSVLSALRHSVPGVRGVHVLQGPATLAQSNLPSGTVQATPSWLALLHETGHIGARQAVQDMAGVLQQHGADPAARPARHLYESAANRHAEAALAALRHSLGSASGLPTALLYHRWARQQEAGYAP